jgi:threonine/homoserine/homoserine lactone efflux protein
MGLLLALVHAGESLAWFSMIILLTGVARGRLNGPRVRRVTERATGVVLIGFAVRLMSTP